MRRKETVALGPKYKGARVSRADLEAQDDDDEAEISGEDESDDDFESAREDLDGASSEYDDPENVDLEADQAQDDAEIDSDNALGDSDEEKFKDFTFRGSSQTLPHRGKRVPRPKAVDFMTSDNDEEDSEHAEEGVEDEEEESVSGDESEEEENLRNGPTAAFFDDEAEESEEDEDGADELEGFIDDAEESSGDDESKDGEDEDQEDDSEEGDSDEDEGSEDEQNDRVNGSASRATLQDMIQTGQRSVAQSLSSAAQKDVAKGKAVRQQQKAFDALLNIRIRLQKSLVAVNSLAAIEEAGDQSEPYEAAEAAAIKLWNSIEGFRSSIQPGTAGKTSQKRKRTADATMSSQDIWETMLEAETRAKARRRAVLENWSQKARNMRTVDRTARKFSGSAEKALTARLDEELEGAPERLIRRTRTPRSCAPLQAARKVNEDARIYDDADFYQLLLKELVDQRSADTSSGGANGGLSSASAATVRFTALAAREAKAKRHVDTKASKGRKMRFNVHEKLQNFMAPEDRRSWEETAIDRLFGTLFGQRMVLDEEEDGDDGQGESDREMGGVSVDDGLRLFRG